MAFKLKVGPGQGLKISGKTGFALPMVGGAGIAAAKLGGIWTVSLDYSEFQDATVLNDDTAYILTWDSVSGVFTRLSVTDFKADFDGEFATPAQGALADSAVQPGDLGALALKDQADVPGDLNATGTPDNTKFLRGDGAWAAVGGSGVSSIAGNTGAFTLSNGITNSTNDIRLAAGAVIDSAYAEYTANTDISSAIPIDDTIPQSGEGVEILTVSITPKSTTNKLRVRFVGLATPSAAANIAVALFLNSETDARAARYSSTAINFAQVFGLELEFVPGSISAQTLKIRAGVSTGTIRFNGTTSSRIFGGVCKTTLIVEEVIV